MTALDKTQRDFDVLIVRDSAPFLGSESLNCVMYLNKGTVVGDTVYVKLTMGKYVKLLYLGDVTTLTDEYRKRTGQ